MDRQTAQENENVQRGLAYENHAERVSIRVDRRFTKVWFELLDNVRGVSIQWEKDWSMD